MQWLVQHDGVDDALVDSVVDPMYGAALAAVNGVRVCEGTNLVDAVYLCVDDGEEVEDSQQEP